MLSNPNTLLPKAAVEFVPNRAVLTFMLPYVGADQDAFVHEIQTVVSDFVHEMHGEMLWSVLHDADAGRFTEGGGTVLITSATRPGSIAGIGQALQNVADRYTSGPVFWTFGPAIVAMQGQAGFVGSTGEVSS